jgi:plasmid stabilization system protein ParE
MREPVEFDPDAQTDFDDASDWYRDQNEVAQQSFIIAIETALESIVRAPQSYPVVFGSKIRRAVIRPFPYTILYTSEEAGIFVNAVFHTSRNPMIGRGRIG